LRIALHCPYSLSVPGGVQGQVLALARELRVLGHHATVLAPIDRDRSRRVHTVYATSRPDETENLVGLGRSVRVRANGSVAPVALGPTASIRALAALRVGQFDVLHLHEPLAPGASYACLWLSGPAKVGTFHRSGESVLYSVLGPLARAFADRLQARCAVSEQARSTVQRALGGTYELIGNGVEVDRFSRAEPWSTDGPTVMFVGRHETRKGLAVLLDAFSRLKNPRAVCWVAGEGPETAKLKELYPPSHSIVWLGRIDDDELAMRLRGSHLACFPSLGGESFGVVLLEAMAARSAIVASDLAGYSAVAEGHAVLVKPGDAAALARQLQISVSDAESGKGGSAPAALDAAFAYASARSMSAVAKRYVSVYETARLLGARK
jgi:phosphatidylinositol alpha-mannosyltransferase